MNQPIHPHLASKSKLTTNQSIYQWRNIFERAIRKNISKIFFHAKTEHTFITEYDNLLRFYNRERLVTASVHRITSNAPVITQRLSGLVLTFLYSDFTYLRDGYQIYMFFFFLITERRVDVFRVATKGQDEVGFKGWVTKYLISLSTNGSTFTHYMEGGKEKVSLLFMSPPSPQFIQPINPGIPIWRMQDSCLINVQE